MYSWEHGFTYDEVCDWLAENVHRYHVDGCGCWAALERHADRLIGLAGLTLEAPTEGTERNGSLLYIVRRDHWGHGYGTECAQAVIAYAFERLHTPRVTALIRVDNLPALYVAAACHMRPVQQMFMPYLGKNVPMVLCALDRKDYEPEPEKESGDTAARTAPPEPEPEPTDKMRKRILAQMEAKEAKKTKGKKD